jgi:SAM-dependent methyltransferase
MTGADIDPTSFGRAAADYATHRAGFPAELFDRLAGLGVGTTGQRAVDLGTGTGTVARQLAGRGCDVVGIDPDTRLMSEARRLAEAEGVEIEWREATAETTGLPDASVDVVTAGQCWHWFDRPAAVAEARRVLRPDTGRLAILYLDWIPLPGNAVAATERLIEAHNPSWIMGGGYGMWPQWVPEVQAGGFDRIETFSFDLDIAYTPEAWRGRIRASAGITVLDADAARAFDAELAAMLAQDFAGEVVPMPHRVWAMVATSRA